MRLHIYECSPHNTFESAAFSRYFEICDLFVPKWAQGKVYFAPVQRAIEYGFLRNSLTGQSYASKPHDLFNPLFWPFGLGLGRNHNYQNISKTKQNQKNGQNTN